MKNFSCCISTLCNKLIFSNNLCDLVMAVYWYWGRWWGVLAHQGECAHWLVVCRLPLNSAPMVLHESLHIAILDELLWKAKVTFLILNEVWLSTCSCGLKTSISRSAYVYWTCLAEKKKIGISEDCKLCEIRILEYLNSWNINQSYLSVVKSFLLFVSPTICW